MKKIPIMFCFNNNFCIPAATCFISIMENANPNNDYYFNILHTDISKTNMDMLKKDMKKYKNCHLKFINMNNRFDKEFQMVDNRAHFSKEVLYKLLCASIFPNEEKIIITDVDVVFLDDIAKMYDAFDVAEDYYYAGIGSIKRNKPSMYRNGDYSKMYDESDITKFENGVGGGFLLANLKLIRKNNQEKVMLDWLIKNSNRIYQMEQDVINITCSNHLKHMPHYYMVCHYEYVDYSYGNDLTSIVTDKDKEEVKYALEHPIQLHYPTTLKPWVYTDCAKSEIWFGFFKKSVYAKDNLDLIIKNGKSVNSLWIKFSKTKIYDLLLKVYHLLRKIFRK